jgi:hypothetical protein
MNFLLVRLSILMIEVMTLHVVVNFALVPDVLASCLCSAMIG